MPEPTYFEALDAYANPFHEFDVEPLSAGLINESFKVTSKNNEYSFLLQKINTKIFKEPEKIQQNYKLLWKYIREEEIDFYLPEPKCFPNDKTFFCDSKNNYWRVFEYVDGTKTKNIAQIPSEAKTAARTFARFTSCFNEFDIEQLQVVIPGFHDLSFRFRQLKDAIKKDSHKRVQTTSQLIDELLSRERYANFYDIITESEEFHLRVMHHDAKISNILFDADNNAVICPVDFDTVMPGYFFSDIGDMIRSMACNYDETSIDFTKIKIRKSYYKAIIEGYSSIMKNDFTSSEKKYIHYSGIIMIYMQALRFLADHLNGDEYYKIDYPEQNFNRAKNQLSLLQQLEDFLKVEYRFKI